MTTAFNIITPEQHVKKEVGKLLADRLSFLEEQRRRLAALPDDINSPQDENDVNPSNCSSKKHSNG